MNRHKLTMQLQFFSEEAEDQEEVGLNEDKVNQLIEQAISKGRDEARKEWDRENLNRKDESSEEVKELEKKLSQMEKEQTLESATKDVSKHLSAQSIEVDRELARLLVGESSEETKANVQVFEKYVQRIRADLWEGQDEAIRKRLGGRIPIESGNKMEEGKIGKQVAQKAKQQQTKRKPSHYFTGRN
ncbi:capsid assembly scaffolding protein Gp46 family protein [Atopococcus tabaci]|uniref:capsid assembly scaffolding protein Gp46 family protein n=1 Tax=Atopococcus tabaci TaxID=269774 RepID=UPI00040EF7DD|nr:DUF4355 domain-containing protein [Atopococcus tabaci]